MHPKLLFSFDRARDIVKRDHNDLLDDYNMLGSLILLAVGMVTTEPTAAAVGITFNALADILGVKNEIATVGKSLLQKLRGRSEGSTLTTIRRMQLAYSVICYTSYFEAFELVMPELANDFQELPDERRLAMEMAVQKVCGVVQVPHDAPVLNMPLALPNPAQPFENQRDRLLPLYKELTSQLKARFEGLPAWEDASEKQRDYITGALKELPKLAFETFKSQYFVLATEFPGFAIWANLREHAETRQHIEQLPNYFQQLLKLIEANKHLLDVGFQQLDAVVRELQRDTAHKQVSQVVDWLENYYNANIEDSILHDSGSDESDTPRQSFPKKSKIFIPQSFKTLCYTGSERLEREETWTQIPTQEDLNTFLLEYLRSPDSILTPLIILGLPGSGKSLLSSIIAARLNLSDYRPIRIELRNIDAEMPLHQQIIQQVENIIRTPIDWATLTMNVDRPLLLILDGYDELLQVRDKVFGNYLNTVAQFQESELDMGRAPVRCIVTSRITLIDKTRISRGTTIVRLNNFDLPRQKKWLSIWNNANQPYFEQTGIQPFTLPKDAKVRELAEQPLLLMMLALYDSIGNSLQQATDLVRTVLYDRLLRRFIQRECLKQLSFREKDDEARQTEIERNMERLGIVAMGMFNRRTFHSNRTQLRDDIRFFTNTQISAISDRDMLDAEKLFGSFFFIYKSQTATRDNQKIEAESSEQQPNTSTMISHSQQNIDAAYEFLHATFGEFLTADFILRKLLQKTKTLHLIQLTPELHNHISNQLARILPDEKDWFGRFIYTSLASRPVVLEMMHEWVMHHPLNNQGLNFHSYLTSILTPQLVSILKGDQIPSTLMTEQQPIFPKLPLIGHFATYSLNLVLLLAVLAPEAQPFIFDETQYDFNQTSSFINSADGSIARPWDRLIYLWRSWFSLISLSELTPILEANRSDTHVRIIADLTFSTPHIDTQLDRIFNVAVALGDDITVALAGLSDLENKTFEQIGLRDLLDLERRLNEERLPLQPWVLARQLQHVRTSFVAQSNNQDSPRRHRLKLTRFTESSEELTSQIESFIDQASREIRIHERKPIPSLMDALLDLERDTPFVLRHETVVSMGRSMLSIALPSHTATAIIRATCARGPLGIEFLEAIVSETTMLSNAQPLYGAEVRTEIIKAANQKSASKELAEKVHQWLLKKYNYTETVSQAVQWIILARYVNDLKFLHQIYNYYVHNNSLLRKPISDRITRIGESTYNDLSTPVLLVELTRLARLFDDEENARLFYNHLYPYLTERQFEESMPEIVLSDLLWAVRASGEEAMSTDIAKMMRKIYNS